jgi:hypothetical protein
MSNGMSPYGPPKIELDKARKVLGMGMPPPTTPSAADQLLAKLVCDPSAKVDVVEVAEWIFDFPQTDATINSTWGPRINVFGTPDGDPPPGISDAFNTLPVPGMPSSDYIIKGLLVAVYVEPEGRLIKGNFWVTPPSGAVNPPSPDVLTLNDFTNGALGTGPLAPTSVNFLPGLFLWGFPTWRFAYNFVLAYELNWFKEHQTSIIKEPLTKIAMIQPFAESDAAGIAFTSDEDRIAALNARLVLLASGAASSIFLELTHKRLGSVTVAAANVGVFAPSREEDGSPTMWGGIGVPQSPWQKEPLMLACPIYWPSGSPLGIEFTVKDQEYQAEMQRWLSLTGGNNGNPGLDLNLPESATLNGFTSSGGNIALEQTLDAIPVLVSQAVNSNRSILKGGRATISVGLLGKRVPQAWKPAVWRAVQQGVIQAPMGYGTLPASGS